MSGKAEKPAKKKIDFNLSALKIQRAFRGFIVRKAYRKMLIE